MDLLQWSSLDIFCLTYPRTCLGWNLRGYLECPINYIDCNKKFCLALSWSSWGVNSVVFQGLTILQVWIHRVTLKIELALFSIRPVLVVQNLNRCKTKLLQYLPLFYSREKMAFFTSINLSIPVLTSEVEHSDYHSTEGAVSMAPLNTTGVQSQ